MCTAIVSMLTGIRVRHDVAMTGEITLRGRVLPIGGLKEKVLAAHRAGIKRVLVPERNKADLDEVPAEVKNDLEFVFASHPDHLATGEAALDAVYPDARNPFAHPELLDDEGLEPWTVPELWIMGPGGEHAGVAVDTTATVERKVAALMCHKSQLPDPDAVAQRVRDWSRANGELAGLPEGRSAELFRVIRIP